AGGGSPRSGALEASRSCVRSSTLNHPEPPMKQALLVIDVQESFRHRPYWNAAEAPAFIANVQALIDRCSSRGIPVLQIFHQELTHDAADPFTAESGHVRSMPELS